MGRLDRGTCLGGSRCGKGCLLESPFLEPRSSTIDSPRASAAHIAPLTCRRRFFPPCALHFSFLFLPCISCLVVFFVLLFCLPSDAANFALHFTARVYILHKLCFDFKIHFCAFFNIGLTFSLLAPAPESRSRVGSTLQLSFFSRFPFFEFLNHFWTVR